jgi:hypothetical protein
MSVVENREHISGRMAYDKMENELELVSESIMIATSP